MGPFIYLFGWDWGYQLWLVTCCTLLAWVTHCFALELGAKSGAWISGISVLVSGVFISALQNGASEGIGLFWLVLGIWKLWSVQNEKSHWYVGLFFALLAGLSSWYSAVILGVFWLCMFSNHSRMWKVSAMWCSFMVPLAYCSFLLTTGETNLIGVKNPEIMDQVRRTIGSSSILSYIAPGSSDTFSELWRYGGNYVHSSYVGVVLFVVFCWAIQKSKEMWLFTSVFICFVLSLGPVLTHKGNPVLFGDGLGFPLPYFALEYVWGFQSLTLLYRLSFGVVLGLALVAGQLLGKRSNLFVAGVFFLMVIEFSVFSPVRNFPSQSSIPSSAGLAILAKKEGGTVLNHPVMSGTYYLFEQTIHKKPIYDSINTATNSAGRDIWSRIAESGCTSFSREKTVYLVSHLEIEHRPQREDRLVQKAMEECSVLYSDQDRIIVEVQ